jgi:hypothetical protein
VRIFIQRNMPSTGSPKMLIPHDEAFSWSVRGIRLDVRATRLHAWHICLRPAACAPGAHLVQAL